MNPTEPPVGHWITIDQSTEGMIVRAVVLILLGLTSALLARAAWDFGGHLARDIPRRVRRSVAGPDLPDWMPTAWMCGRCLSTNLRSAARCSQCRAARAEVEMHFVQTSEPIDSIPDRIDVGESAVVSLEHDPKAHADPDAGHWKLRVNGRIAGTAAASEGVVRLLRSVHGADVAWFDPLGSGPRSYRLDELAAAFERRPIPLRTPCPELLAV